MLRCVPQHYTEGITMDDPALDFALAAAILSSNEDIPVEHSLCFAG